MSARIGELVTLTYRCSAAELTAGNTYLNFRMVLLNPVNCLVYPLGHEEEEIQLDLLIPKDFETATSLRRVSREFQGLVRFAATGIQELFDSPILAADDLIVLKYSIGDTMFYIHLCEGPKLNHRRILADFKAFTEVQIAAFGSFPVNEYHFILLFLPHKAYHGVEHEKSTMIILGPGTEVDRYPLYHDLLGISSHELYHTWNVKHLRPADWSPYDFTGPAFSRLGYVAEGVTTYMGDWMLWQAGIFSDRDFLRELNTHFHRHLLNSGRFHLSLGDASIDTWTDGYSRTVPGRRVSIYIEGALLAFVCDVWLMKDGQSSLSEFMRQFYELHSGPQGYKEDEWWGDISANSNLPWQKLRNDVVNGTGKLESYVLEAFNELGLEVLYERSPKFWESVWGIKMELLNGAWTVTHVEPDSPAAKASIFWDQRILAINGQEADKYFAGGAPISDGRVMVKLMSGWQTLETVLAPDEVEWLQTPNLRMKSGDPSPLFKRWKEILLSPEKADQ